MKKAIFLDRDGTINIDPGYVNDPDQIVFIRGAKKAVKKLRDNGFLVFIITNQSGVGRGRITMEQLKAVNDKVIKEFKKDNIEIDGVFSCIHTPDDRCDCRKPSPKAVLDIAKQYEIDLGKSYFVGDKLSDVETGLNAGCRTVLLDTNFESTLKKEHNMLRPDCIVENLYEAADWIIENMGEKKHREAV